MSEHNPESRKNSSGYETARRGYESPVAHWHDLKVITLGGATGFDDSGCLDCQDPQNGASGYDGDPSRGNPGGP